jgi:hypothetical protein
VTAFCSPANKAIPIARGDFPQAKHDFIAGVDYRADDAADAWACPTEALRQHLAKMRGRWNLGK